MHVLRMKTLPWPLIDPVVAAQRVFRPNCINQPLFGFVCDTYEEAAGKGGVPRGGERETRRKQRDTRYICWSKHVRNTRS